MARYTLSRNTNPVTEQARAAILANPGFGVYFADYMALANYTAERGWHDHRIQPTGAFTLAPSAAVLHYGQEIFEGLKAYRHEDDSIWLFRPERNAIRFANSARRLQMAELPKQDFITSLLELVDLERAWVPPANEEQSMYLRPFMFADEPLLGVRAARTYTYALLATPVGAYYPKPVTLWVTKKFTRAAAGGTGEAKCGGNYAASLAAAAEAERHGCEQVLYTDGAHHQWIEESGTMNFMLVTATGELVTPALGSILPGITRASLLELASLHDLRPIERQISLEELFTGLSNQTITEVFCCGTAAVITPIIGFKTPDQGDFTVGDGTPGPKTTQLRTHLLDIQYGRIKDPFGWMLQVK